MAALDTFEWLVSTMINDASPEIQQFVRSQREYLLSLRSEDERQRFVDDVILELRLRVSPKIKHP